jgi:hypothetical protein
MMCRWFETPMEREQARRSLEEAAVLAMRKINWPYCRHGKLAQPCADCQRMVGDPHCVRHDGRRTCDRPQSAHPLADCVAFLRPGDPP